MLTIVTILMQTRTIPVETTGLKAGSEIQ